MLETKIQSFTHLDYTACVGHGYAFGKPAEGEVVVRQFPERPFKSNADSSCHCTCLENYYGFYK